MTEIEALRKAGLISASVMRARLRRVANNELAEIEAQKERLRAEIEKNA
jgi:hypothetical protein